MGEKKRSNNTVGATELASCQVFISSFTLNQTTVYSTGYMKHRMLVRKTIYLRAGPDCKNSECQLLLLQD